jgi:DNA polymerase kappa
MPGFIARKLCPQLIIVPGSFSKYKRESQIIRSVFERYDPNVSMGSLDEAQLDITEYLGRRTASGAHQSRRERIKEKII